MAGSLIVAGIGIRLAAQCTPEARMAIETAEIVYAAAGDSLALRWLGTLNPHTISLHGFYGGGRTRAETYAAMADAIVAAVRSGKRVCAVFYGHPGVFVDPSHEAIRRVRAGGLEARMLPGISAEDCLFADLGLDPGRRGCQSYEATDFLLRDRRFDPEAPLILWQVGVVGDLTLTRLESDPAQLERLASILRQEYPADHGVTVYEAATLPVARPRIELVSLGALQTAELTLQSTLYVPPRGRAGRSLAGQDTVSARV